MANIKILVPIDFTRESLKALKYAGMVALQLNAKITCLHIIEQETISKNNNSTVNQDKKRRQAQVRLAKIANRILFADGIPFDIIVSKGEKISKIYEIATDLKVKFILMGKRKFKDSNIDNEDNFSANMNIRSEIPVIQMDKNVPFEFLYQ